MIYLTPPPPTPQPTCTSNVGTVFVSWDGTMRFPGPLTVRRPSRWRRLLAAWK